MSRGVDKFCPCWELCLYHKLSCYWLGKMSLPIPVSFCKSWRRWVLFKLDQKKNLKSTKWSFTCLSLKSNLVTYQKNDHWIFQSINSCQRCIANGQRVWLCVEQQSERWASCELLLITHNSYLGIHRNTKFNDRISIAQILVVGSSNVCFCYVDSSICLNSLSWYGSGVADTSNFL